MNGALLMFLWFSLFGKVCGALQNAAYGGKGDVLVERKQGESIVLCISNVIWAGIIIYLLIGQYYPQ